MATTIERFSPAKKRYPWKRWTNGKAWRVVRGIDFDCTIPGFESVVYSHAKRKRLAVKVARKGDAVEFVFSRRK